MQIPLDVPAQQHSTYTKNFETATQGSGRLMLFAGDQKVEHLNDDFYGKDIAADDADPEHLFRIADRAHVGVFATQLGLISRYGMDYRNIPYLVKLNSKTHLVKTAQMDPISPLWYPIQPIVDFKKHSKLNIVGVGFTIYLGSEHEAEMLAHAARIVYEAHKHGLLSVLWIYPRGKAVLDEKDPHLVAGATGVAASLGSDFVKVNYPKPKSGNRPASLKEAVVAAGRTKVICAGGSSIEVSAFLQTLYDQIHIGGVSGNATGRNIHQKPLNEAVRFCNAIHALTVEGKSVDAATAIYHGK